MASRDALLRGNRADGDGDGVGEDGAGRTGGDENREAELADNGRAHQLTAVEHVKGIFVLFPSIFLTRVCWVGLKATDTALLGRAGTGTHYLQAAALSDLWTNASGVLVQGRVLGILAANSIGAGHPEQAGEWFQLSVYVLAPIGAVVMILWALTEPVISLLEDDKSLTHDAAYYSLVLMACIPARIGFSQLSQLFAAQKIVQPFALTALVGLVVNLLLGLQLVLGIPISRLSFGFAACPIVTSSVEWVMLLFVLIVYCLILGQHSGAWPKGGCAGWSLSHVTFQRIGAYLHLYVPAALSIASDFWRFSAVGSIAATLSKSDLAIFNASYRVMWICLTISGSLASAIGIRLALSLGAAQPSAAKAVVAIGISIAAAFLVAMGASVALFPRQLALIFSDESAVADGFESMAIAFALTTVLMNLAVILEGVVLTTGRTRTVLFAGIIGSWVGQVPACLLLTRYWARNLTALYTGVGAGYAILCVALAGALVLADWEGLAQEAAARARAGARPAEKLLGGANALAAANDAREEGAATESADATAEPTPPGAPATATSASTR